MPSSKPFIDPATGALDRQQLLLEAVPLAKLVGLFVAISLVPFALAVLAFGSSPLAAILTTLGQFVLAVGAGIVIIYAVARGETLASD